MPLAAAQRLAMLKSNRENNKAVAGHTRRHGGGEAQEETADEDLFQVKSKQALLMDLPWG